MASVRTYVDGRNAMVYRYTRETDCVTAEDEHGGVVIEKMSRSLVQRLEAQGVPAVLWKGSKGASKPKAFCPFCKDTGFAYGGPCVC